MAISGLGQNSSMYANSVVAGQQHSSSTPWIVGSFLVGGCLAGATGYLIHRHSTNKQKTNNSSSTGGAQGDSATLGGQSGEQRNGSTIQSDLRGAPSSSRLGRSGSTTPRTAQGASAAQDEFAEWMEKAPNRVEIKNKLFAIAENESLTDDEKFGQGEALLRDWAPPRYHKLIPQMLAGLAETYSEYAKLTAGLDAPTKELFKELNSWMQGSEGEAIAARMKETVREWKAIYFKDDGEPVDKNRVVESLGSLRKQLSAILRGGIPRKYNSVVDAVTHFMSGEIHDEMRASLNDHRSNEVRRPAELPSAYRSEQRTSMHVEPILV